MTLKNFSTIDCPQIAYFYGLFVRRADVKQIDLKSEALAQFVHSYVPCRIQGSKITLEKDAFLKRNETIPIVLSDDLMPYFIRGLFDQKGCIKTVPKYWTAEITMRGYDTFLQSIFEFFEKCGYDAEIKKTESNHQIISSQKSTISAMIDLLFGDHMEYIQTVDPPTDMINKFLASRNKNNHAKPLSAQMQQKVNAISGHEKIKHLTFLYGKLHPSYDDIDQMIKFYDSGVSYPIIAAMYGCTPSYLGRMLPNKRGLIARNASEAHTKYPKDQNFFDCIDTEEKAYMLGFIWADGCNHLEDNYIRINISQQDKEILYRFSSLIFKTFSEDRVYIYDRERKYESDPDKVFIEKTCRLDICSKHMCETLNSIGCTPCKSLTCTFPTVLGTDDLKRHFIRGYFDGDGSIYSNKYDEEYFINFIGTYETLKSIDQIISNAVGVSFGSQRLATKRITKDEEVNCFKIEKSGNRQNIQIMDWLYKDATIYLERKHKKYEALKSRLGFVTDPTAYRKLPIMNPIDSITLQSMKKEYDSGFSYQDLADKYEISKYDISDNFRKLGFE